MSQQKMFVLCHSIAAKSSIKSLTRCQLLRNCSHAETRRSQQGKEPREPFSWYPPGPATRSSCHQRTCENPDRGMMLTQLQRPTQGLCMTTAGRQKISRGVHTALPGAETSSTTRHNSPAGTAGRALLEKERAPTASAAAEFTSSAHHGALAACI